MGLLSKFEGKMEDTVEGAAEKLGASPISPVQIAKKAERQMRREKMVGTGKQYAPTLYTVLVSKDDDERLFGYYPTLAGETETYLAAKAAENGLAMDGQPLVRFIADDNLKSGKFDVIAEMVAAPIIEQLRDEEMEHYGIAASGNGNNARNGGRSSDTNGADNEPLMRPIMSSAAGAANNGGYDDANIGGDEYNSAYNNQNDAAGYRGADYQDSNYQEPNDAAFDQQAAQQQQQAAQQQASSVSDNVKDIYLYDITHDCAFTLDGRPVNIGRESKCDITIPDINVSRSHAEIRRDASGAWILSDLGSTNGTFVNGRQIKSMPLRDADRITIGTTDLEFQIL